MKPRTNQLKNYKKHPLNEFLSRNSISSIDKRLSLFVSLSQSVISISRRLRQLLEGKGRRRRLGKISKGFERSLNVRKKKRKNFDHTGYSEFLIDLNTKTGNSRTVIKGRASVRQVERKINWNEMKTIPWNDSRFNYKLRFSCSDAGSLAGSHE